MTGRRVLVEAPASSANLGCGFDIFALALEGPRDTLWLETSSSRTSLEVGGPVKLSGEPAKNVVAAVASAIMTEHRLKGGVSMRLEKEVPIGLGLGSSAASSVAAAVGIDRVFGLKLSEKEIVGYAGVGEKAASGTAHYDNVAASFAGGFVVVGWDHGFVRIEPPKTMALCLVTPEVTLPSQKTRYARSLLPKRVPLERAVAVSRAASTMVHGFTVGSLDEIGDAMAVSIADDSRAIMVPGFEKVRLAALSAGASGVCISGAGPTVLAVSEKRTSHGVMRAMIREFKNRGVRSQGFVSTVGKGCRVVEK